MRLVFCGPSSIVWFYQWVTGDKVAWLTLFFHVFRSLFCLQVSFDRAVWETVLFRVDLTRSISSFLSFSWSQSLSARCSSVMSVQYCAFMCKRMFWAKMQVLVSGHAPVVASRKATESFFSFSIVKLIEFSTALIWLKRSVSLICLRRTKMSSMYRFQSFGPDIKAFSARVSTSSITMFAITADTGEPTAVPKICW